MLLDAQTVLVKDYAWVCALEHVLADVVVIVMVDVEDVAKIVLAHVVKTAPHIVVDFVILVVKQKASIALLVT
jgi:hypothetical protein